MKQKEARCIFSPAGPKSGFLLLIPTPSVEFLSLDTILFPFKTHLNTIRKDIKRKSFKERNTRRCPIAPISFRKGAKILVSHILSENMATHKGRVKKPEKDERRNKNTNLTK